MKENMNMRKIGINTRSTSGITDERYIELIAELGFDSAFSDVHFGRKDLHNISELLAKKGAYYNLYMAQGL